MNDKEYAKQKKRVQKYIDKFQKPLGFNWWGITHEFNREASERHPGACGITHTQWQYRNAWITWQLDQIKTISEEELEECVLHEFCHLLVGSVEPDDDMRGQWELAVTNIQRCVAWALKIGEKPDAKV